MSIVRELKRRNVFKVAIAYVIVGWLLLQVSDTLVPALHLPEWFHSGVAFLVILGFPITLIMAWAFELTPEGIMLEKDVVRSESVTHLTGRKLDFFIIAALSLVLVFVVIDQYVLEEPPLSPEVAESLRSIAVLPFANRSAEEENAAFFADGIHDELLTRLAKIADLKVISRTSVMEYRDTTKNMRQIGAELGVGSILEGAVQRAGDRVRINVQLIDAQTDEHLWADTYERKLNTTNIFSIQSEISIAIAKALRATLTPDEQERLAAVPTESMEALDAYFLGKQLLERRTRESLFAAVEYFEEVIEFDPDFALGHSGLADAYMILPEYDATIDLDLVKERSVAEVTRALELDPNIPEVLASMAWNLTIHEYKWDEAETLLRRALEIEPNNTNALHWLSHVLSWQGQHAEAIKFAARAVEVDPLSSLMPMNLSYILVDNGRFDEAISLAREVWERDPGLSELMGNLWLSMLRAGRVEDAVEAIQIWAVATKRDTEAVEQIGQLFLHYQQTGEPVHLPADLLERAAFGSEDIGQVYAFFGDVENTLAALDQAVKERSGARSVLSMKVNPLYDFIRDDPRFLDLMTQAGLTQ